VAPRNVDSRRQKGAVSPFLLGSLYILVIDYQKLVLANLVTAAALAGLYRFTGDGINELLAKAMARAPVHAAKREPFLRGDRRIESNRACNERELEEASPKRTRGHNYTPWNCLQMEGGMECASLPISRGISVGSPEVRTGSSRVTLVALLRRRLGHNALVG
jgi:hypothetical protein